MMLISVDLPAPFGPNRPKNSPRLIARLTPFNACTLPKRFCTSTISIALLTGNLYQRIGRHSHNTSSDPDPIKKAFASFDATAMRIGYLCSFIYTDRLYLKCAGCCKKGGATSLVRGQNGFAGRFSALTAGRLIESCHDNDSELAHTGYRNLSPAHVSGLMVVSPNPEATRRTGKDNSCQRHAG